MNDWRFRVVVAAMLYVLADIHDQATIDWPNNSWWMLLYHGSAATLEFLIFLSLPWLLKGKLLHQMQTLSVACICVNFCGFFIYQAKAPPFLNDFLIGVLGYVQYGKLFMGDRNVSDLIRDCVGLGYWARNSRSST
jgi:hypothetical protein